MYHTLLHIYGPFAIHSFGLMFAIALGLFIWLVQRDPSSKAILVDQNLIDIILFGTIIILIGGRLLYIFSNWAAIEQWSDLLAFWNGGSSLLGCIIALLIALPRYLIKKGIPLLPFLDLLALYAPLSQALGRIGCFLAGCCYGKQTAGWGITYTDSNSIAPLGVCLHPTQLYSAFLLIMIFLILYYGVRPRMSQHGQLLCAYLILTNLERFIIDFYRGDQEFFSLPTLAFFSMHQWIALAFIVGGIMTFAYLSLYTPKTSRTYESF